MTLYGIKVGLGPDVRVFSGYAHHRYAFTSKDDARAFIDEHWTQFSPGWRRKHLTVAPLPPYVTVPGHYLTMGRKA
jgi:hypothetical protein